MPSSKGLKEGNCERLVAEPLLAGSWGVVYFGGTRSCSIDVEGKAVTAAAVTFGAAIVLLFTVAAATHDYRRRK